MISIHDPTDINTMYPLIIDGDKWHIKHTYEGNEVLSFEIPSQHELYKYIAEEVRISANNNRFVVKNIDDHSNSVIVDCEVDLDEWRASFWREYRRTNKYLSEILDEIKPAGWTISGAAISTARKTMEASEGQPLENVNPLDLLGRAMEVYGVTVNYDIPKRILYVINPTTYTASGEYFTDELNLKSIGYTGTSSDFATRLYAYGKKDDKGNPLTFSSINNGKEYVEDKSYSSNTISVGWSDERYTVKQNLLNAAKKKLSELSFPVRSYTCEVRNLNKDMWLYKVVTLIDRRRRTRVDHRVVEYDEYPDDHSFDIVTLSATAPKIQNSIKKIQADMADQKAESVNFMIAAIEHATSMITGEKGGHLVIKKDDVGKPQGFLIMDTENADTAKKVWQWNLSGLGYSANGVNGPYATAITADGAIVADRITTGTMTANRVRGGTFEVGGKGVAADGLIMIRNADGTKTGQIDKNGIMIISPEGSVSLNDGALHFIDAKKNLDAGRLSYNSAKNMLCMGSYGGYESFGLGYWAGNDFKSMIQINRTNSKEFESIEFKGINETSVNGRKTYNGDVYFVNKIEYNEDGSLHWDLGVMNVTAGMIML